MGYNLGFRNFLDIKNQTIKKESINKYIPLLLLSLECLKHKKFEKIEYKKKKKNEFFQFYIPNILLCPQ